MKIRTRNQRSRWRTIRSGVNLIVVRFYMLDAGFEDTPCVVFAEGYRISSFVVALPAKKLRIYALQSRQPLSVG